LCGSILKFYSEDGGGMFLRKPPLTHLTMWHHTSKEHNTIQAASCRFLQTVTPVQFVCFEE